MVSSVSCLLIKLSLPLDGYDGQGRLLSLLRNSNGLVIRSEDRKPSKLLRMRLMYFVLLYMARLWHPRNCVKPLSWQLYWSPRTDQLLCVVNIIVHSFCIVSLLVTISTHCKYRWTMLLSLALVTMLWMRSYVLCFPMFSSYCWTLLLNSSWQASYYDLSNVCSNEPCWVPFALLKKYDRGPAAIWNSALSVHAV